MLITKNSYAKNAKKEYCTNLILTNQVLRHFNILVKFLKKKSIIIFEKSYYAADHMEVHMQSTSTDPCEDHLLDPSH